MNKIQSLIVDLGVEIRDRKTWVKNCKDDIRTHQHSMETYTKELEVLNSAVRALKKTTYAREGKK